MHANKGFTFLGRPSRAIVSRYGGRITQGWKARGTAMQARALSGATLATVRPDSRPTNELSAISPRSNSPRPRRGEPIDPRFRLRLDAGTPGRRILADDRVNVSIDFRVLSSSSLHFRQK